MRKLERLAGDGGFRSAWRDIKHDNKRQFAGLVQGKTGVVIDPESMFGTVSTAGRNLLLHDPYLVLADFRSYVDCQHEVGLAYADRERWPQMSILNTARSGKFSSDCTIREYCEQIWRAKQVPIKMLSREDVKGKFLQYRRLSSRRG